MRSFIACISPQATVWASVRETERATEALERTRRVLDEQEAEALATRRADARRARRQSSRDLARVGR